MCSDAIVVTPSHVPDANASSGASASSVPSSTGSTPKAPERVLSIDALRGFDMFWIIGGDALMLSALACIKQPWAATLSDQWRHVEWEGFPILRSHLPDVLILGRLRAALLDGPLPRSTH